MARPRAFHPDRWLGRPARQRPRYAYFPFGGGPRSCIGESFAWMEGMLLIATLAQCCAFRLADPTAPVRLHADDHPASPRTVTDEIGEEVYAICQQPLPSLYSARRC